LKSFVISLIISFTVTFFTIPVVLKFLNKKFQVEH
jgi:UDP-N-acetylmuramyl pentapeptide phosphotransferase/UDP-N-acetylglucosamine-1-phosphate transferase